MNRKDKLALGALLGWKGFAHGGAAYDFVSNSGLSKAAVNRWMHTDLPGSCGEDDSPEAWSDEIECLLFVTLWLQEHPHD